MIQGYYPAGIKGVDADYVAVLAGNPNTGKSTVFNALTGLNQHTGNWPGRLWPMPGVLSPSGKGSHYR